MVPPSPQPVNLSHQNPNPMTTYAKKQRTHKILRQLQRSYSQAFKRFVRRKPAFIAWKDTVSKQHYAHTWEGQPVWPPVSSPCYHVVRDSWENFRERHTQRLDTLAAFAARIYQ